VYHQPASTFVASFIGSPPMNLITGEGKAGRFHAAGVDCGAAPRDGALIMGVRPEHMDFVSANEGLRFEVEMVEALGAQYLVHGKLAGAGVIVTQASLSSPLADGDVIGVRLDPAKLHYFDATSTKRI
jgi:sn-glycerol 3-phosphate transport system ATP-binding protein